MQKQNDIIINLSPTSLLDDMVLAEAQPEILERQSVADGLGATLPTVYLDFAGPDGISGVTYHNGGGYSIVDNDNITVSDSQFSSEEITTICAALNADSSINANFVTDVPESGSYCTVYIGTTDAFSALGLARGITENIDNGVDHGNAFVVLDASTGTTMTTLLIKYVLQHYQRNSSARSNGGVGIDAYTDYGDVVSVSGTTRTSLSLLTMKLADGASVDTIEKVSKYGVIDVYPGAVLSDISISTNGWVNVMGSSASQAVINRAALDDANGIAFLNVYGGGVANNVSVSRGRMVVSGSDGLPAYAYGTTLHNQQGELIAQNGAVLSEVYAYQRSTVTVIGSTLSNVLISETGTKLIAGPGSTITGATISNRGGLEIQDSSDITINSLTLDRTPSVPLDVHIFGSHDFSETDITILGTFTNDRVGVLQGSLTFAPNQVITVNGIPSILNDPDSVGYRVDYNRGSDSDNTLYVSLPRGTIMSDYSTGLRKAIEYDPEAKNITFGAVGKITKNQLNLIDDKGKEIVPNIPNKVLTANNNKGLIGKGIGDGVSSGTCIQATMFSNGHYIFMKDLNWDGYFVAGALSKLYADNHLDIRNNTRVLYGFGGTIVNGALTTVASPSDNTSVTKTDTGLTIGSNANSTGVMLSGGNYVTVGDAITVIGDSSLIIEADSNLQMSATGDYVIGGSVVQGTGTSYCVTGTSTVDMASGALRFLLGSGYLRSASYEKDSSGDYVEAVSYSHTVVSSDASAVDLTVTGGTITKAVFGGIGSGEAAFGSKTITGDVNLLFDSSERAISLHTVYGGCNGAGVIHGNINVTFTGLGSKLTFTNTEGRSCVCGDNASNESAIEGSTYSRNLFFKNFQGDFGAEVVNKFDTINFTDGSDVTMSASSLATVSVWNFDADSCLTWNDVYNNSFADDTLNFGKAGDTLTEDYIFFSADDSAAVQDFDQLAEISIFGTTATGSSAWNAGIKGYAVGDYQIVQETDDQTYWNLVVKLA